MKSANLPLKKKARVASLFQTQRLILAFLIIGNQHTDGLYHCIEYAQVIKMLGNGRLEALCFDGEKRLAQYGNVPNELIASH